MESPRVRQAKRRGSRIKRANATVEKSVGKSQDVVTVLVLVVEKQVLKRDNRVAAAGERGLDLIAKYTSSCKEDGQDN